MNHFLHDLLLLAAAGAALASAEPIYHSDFRAQCDEAAQLGAWRLAGGRYMIRDGWLCVRSEKSNSRAVLRVRHRGDGTFRATVRNARACHRTGLLARGVYLLRVDRQFGRLELHRRTGGGWRMEAHAAGWWHAARFVTAFELRIVRLGRKVLGFVDDKQLVEYDDPAAPPADGEFGLIGGWGTDVGWRDISLSGRPDISEWPVNDPPKAAPTGLVIVTRVRSNLADNIYFDGERPTLRFDVTTARDTRQRVRLTCRLIDVGGREVARTVHEAALSRGAVSL
jgi:hypothetical protein